MSPNDTLNFGNTMPKDSPTAGESSAESLDLGQTIKMPGMGTLIFGRYRLQRVLGRGGMGVVWLAVDTKLERTVALKFLPDIIGADPVALRDLKDETRRGLELAHPNIVRIYDFVDDEEAAAISMEFVDGKSLSENRLVKPHKVFSTEEIAPWIGQMCDALDYAHIQRRIVHRDLKPANLMVNAESQLKITDFGIARSVSESMSRLSVQNANTSGTLLYMSPQQAMGDRPRATDDIYSVGATIYELLTGKPPFYSGDITRQITAKTAPTLKQRREELEIAASDDIPTEWEQVIAACLDKDPERRPQTAGELARRLGIGSRAESPTPTSSAVRSTGLHALKVPATARSVTSANTGVSSAEKSKPVVSRPLLMMIAAAILLLLLAGGGLWWWTNRPGGWELQTVPAGAQITVAGRTLGSPAVFSDLKPGAYVANINLAGYEPEKVEIDIAAGQKVNLGAVNLVRSMGRVMVTSYPTSLPFEIKSTTDGPGAGNTRGDTPETLTLPVGRYAVTIKHEGETKTRDVVILRDEAAEPLEFEFKVAPPPPVVADTPPPPSSSETMPPAAPVTPPPATPPSTSAMTPQVAAASVPAPSPDAPPMPSTSAAPPEGGGAPNQATIAAAMAAQVGPPAPGTIGASSAPKTELGAKLGEILGGSPYAGYSEKGMQYVLYRAQQKLDISADGKPGPGTQKAISNYQSENSLTATGQLDEPTLASLGLTGLDDKSGWSRPSSGGGGGRSGGRSGGSREEEGPIDKAKAIGKSIGKGVSKFFR